MTSAIATARRLRAEARDHKRLSQQHRRLARQKMAELRELCEIYGIEFVEEDGDVEGHGPGTDAIR